MQVTTLKNKKEKQIYFGLFFLKISNISKIKKKYLNENTNKQTNKQTNERTNERTTNERTTNERTKFKIRDYYSFLVDISVRRQVKKRIKGWLHLSPLHYFKSFYHVINRCRYQNIDGSGNEYSILLFWRVLPFGMWSSICSDTTWNDSICTIYSGTFISFTVYFLFKYNKSESSFFTHI